MTNQFYTKIQVDEQGRFIGEELRKVKNDLTTYVNNKSVTQEERDKLAGLESSKYLGTFTASSELPTANAGPGSYADVDVGEGLDVERWVFDTTDGVFVKLGSTIGPDTAATIKSKYESNPNTNAFTDSDKAKLASLESFIVAADINDFILALEGTPEGSANEGLASNYSGTGWYKATDTGIVFSKDVIDGETFRFTPDGPEYLALSDDNKHLIFDEDYGSYYFATSNVTNMSMMFYGQSEENIPGERLKHWDVSNVTDMSYMFNGASMNPEIGNWDVRGVTNMGSMFHGNEVFNQNISAWNTSSVLNMSDMFGGCAMFNQNISNWNVSAVENMSQMFWNTANFNQNISTWNVNSVVSMDNMFTNAVAFNQDLSEWCVSNITEEPYQFSESATSWTLPKPVWGTCPRGENVPL